MVTAVVETRCMELRQEIKEKLIPIRQVAYDDIDGLKKRRQHAIKLLVDHAGGVRPSTAPRTFRARVKMSKKIYKTIATQNSFVRGEAYAKKLHFLKMNVSDTFKAIVMVTRYDRALTEKIDTLVQELANEYNSTAWNTVIHDKRLEIDQQRGGHQPERVAVPRQVYVDERAKAKPKAKAGRGRGRGRRDGRAMQEDPPTPPVDGYSPRGPNAAMGEITPPMLDLGELANFQQLEVKSFKGPWNVICGQMRAEATVNADGSFDMHQKYAKGQPGGWSALGCKLSVNSGARTFMAAIDHTTWKMVEADMDPNGKSTVVWESGDNPQSVWTRSKRAPSADSVKAQPASQRVVQAKAKPKAKTQARSGAPVTPRSTSNVVEPYSPQADGGRNGPPPSVEWYTEIREGRLMWTDGVSAVPAEDRVAEDNRQKTKMQF